MSHLTDFLAGSGYVIVLSDAKGCLLDVIGDVAIRRRLARIDFIPGGDWSEAAAGTNAIGTALADGHVVQFMGAEHYCDGWQDLTCTAAPIRPPIDRRDYRCLRCDWRLPSHPAVSHQFLGGSCHGYLSNSCVHCLLLRRGKHETIFLETAASFPSDTSPHEINVTQ